MDWQQATALAIVALAAVLLVHSRLRKRKFQFGRDTHCGCSSLGKNRPQGTIVYHARKGERPRVLMKMK